MFVLAAALNGTSEVGKNERVFTGSVDNWSTNYRYRMVTGAYAQ